MKTHEMSVSTKITVKLDTWGTSFMDRTADHDLDEGLSEPAFDFWKQCYHLVRQLLSSSAGGSFVLAMPESATSAEAILRLNAVPVAQKHGEDGQPHNVGKGAALAGLSEFQHASHVAPSEEHKILVGSGEGAHPISSDWAGF